MKCTIYADKGCIKQNLFMKLYLIETVFDYLKNKMNIENTRHRFPINAFVYIGSTIIGYSLKSKKPCI